ncbi:VC0807 family protein [Nocardioides sp.]|uniref:VC0807 family protein n=1 Tax=Nocardioides sp. TaxID=35761 RepID=UPI002715FA7C|nr:VC0807 family protein [Nocardioides sp.]MDO9457505.1 VC0807 family protein [Nocardioides sp.]
MTSLDVAPPAVATHTCPHGAALWAIMRQLSMSLLVACAVPAVLFYAVLEVAGITTAILTALGWSYGAIAWRRLTGRSMSGLLILTSTILTIRTIFTLSTGNTYIYFLQPVVSDAIVAVVFLISLATARPLVDRLAADFYPMSPDLAGHPRVRRLFWRLTLMWGGVCVAKGVVGFWLLASLSVANFVLIKSSAMIGMTALAVAVTIWASLVVLRHDSVSAA